MHFGGHIGFLAAILDLRPNLRWPRSIFQIVWSKVHESTEKTLAGKKGSFTWLGPCLITLMTVNINKTTGQQKYTTVGRHHETLLCWFGRLSVTAEGFSR